MTLGVVNAQKGVRLAAEADDPSARRSWFGKQRQCWWLAWMAYPAAYALSAPPLALAGAIATLSAPLLLAPEAFGRYVLLLTLFQYVSCFDLGLSQLTDQSLGQPRRIGADVGLETLLWTRLLLAAAILSVAIPVVCEVQILNGSSQTADLWLALGAGVAFMVANGTVSIYRIRRQTWEFTFSALLLQLGLSGPRLGGLLIAGTTGCFAAVAGWYIVAAVALVRPFAALMRSRPTARRVLATLCTAAPLFVFNTFWLLFIMANRWVASALSDARSFGLFGLGASLAAVVVGLIGTVAQSAYPKYLVSRTDRETTSAALAGELLRLVAGATAAMIAAELFCRYGLSAVFPKFTAARNVTGASLLAIVPLSLNAWIMPIVIGLSHRPWREAAMTFSVALAALAGGMIIGEACVGLVGQALGTVPASLILLGLLLRLLVSHHILSGRAATQLLLWCLSATALVSTLWLVLSGFGTGAGS